MKRENCRFTIKTESKKAEKIRGSGGGELIEPFAISENYLCSIKKQNNIPV